MVCNGEDLHDLTDRAVDDAEWESSEADAANLGLTNNLETMRRSARPSRCSTECPVVALAQPRLALLVVSDLLFMLQSRLGWSSKITSAGPALALQAPVP